MGIRRRWWGKRRGCRGGARGQHRRLPFAGQRSVCRAGKLRWCERLGRAGTRRRIGHNSRARGACALPRSKRALAGISGPSRRERTPRCPCRRRRDAAGYTIAIAWRPAVHALGVWSESYVPNVWRRVAVAPVGLDNETVLLEAPFGVRQAGAVLAHGAGPAALCMLRCGRTPRRYANHQPLDE